MRTVVFEGTLTALSSIAHAGEAAGRVHTLRRETLVGPDGRLVSSVPVISGAAIRGWMRRAGARMVHEALAQDGLLPFTIELALTQGGALAETRSAREVLTGDRQARLRELVPFLGLMGVAGGGRVMSGRLEVSKALPVARQTLPLIPSPARERYEAMAPGGGWASVFSLVQYEGYSVAPDGAGLGAVVEGGGLEGVSPMRFEEETLAAGTRLWHRVSAVDATAMEVGVLDDLMAAWVARGRLGGRRGKGMGLFEGEYRRSVLDAWGRPCADEPGGDWVGFMRERREDVLEALSWL